jgi:hypothetical protein
MNIDKKLDVLKQMKEAEAPPFLLTRIRQRIEALNSTAAPVKWKWTIAVSFILILAINLSAFFNTGNDITAKKNAAVQNIVSSMNLSTANDLYNE